MEKILHDETTKQERVERSKAKDKNYRKMLREIRYKTKGEVFLKARIYASAERFRRQDDYQLLNC